MGGLAGRMLLHYMQCSWQHLLLMLFGGMNTHCCQAVAACTGTGCLGKGLYGNAISMQEFRRPATCCTPAAT